MAANDELPRGLVLGSNPGTNAQAVVTYPATAGVSWVLTQAEWEAYVNGETIAAEGLIGVNVNGVLALTLGIWTINAQSGWQTMNGSWQGSFAGGVGQSLQVFFSSSYSGGSEELTASAYPI